CQARVPCHVCLSLPYAEKDSLTSHSGSSAHHSGSISSPNLLSGLSPRKRAGSADVVDLQCARTFKFLSPHLQTPTSRGVTTSSGHTAIQTSTIHRPRRAASWPRRPAPSSFPASLRCARRTVEAASPRGSSSALRDAHIGATLA